METKNTTSEMGSSVSEDRIRDIPFIEKEIHVIASCSFWMRFMGYFANISALFYITVGIVIIFSSFIPKANMKNIYVGLAFIAISFLPYFMGKWILRSARAFMDVINTAIDDQGFLIEGFSFLQKFFLSLGVIFIFIISLLLLGIIFISVNSIKISDLF